MQVIASPAFSQSTHKDWRARFGQTFKFHGFGRVRDIYLIHISLPLSAINTARPSFDDIRYSRSHSHLERVSL